MSDESITYRDADELVRRFVSEKSKTRAYITVKSVCRSMEIPENEHNRKRVLDAVKRKFEEDETWSNREKKFKIER